MATKVTKKVSPKKEELIKEEVSQVETKVETSTENVQVEEKHVPLLEVKELHTSFNIPTGEVRSVNGVSFTLEDGKVLGIVGESGSGKSVTAYSILQILQDPGKVVSGSIKFKGRELVGLEESELRKIRGQKISIIFQDPMTSLNPVFTIGYQLKEVLKLHNNLSFLIPFNETINNLRTQLKDNKKNKNLTKDQIKEIKQKIRETKKEKEEVSNRKIIEILELVGINEPKKRIKQYPFEFSGGMLQRIMIAMALLGEPDILIADEPTTALDVTIQAQILELLKSLQEKIHMGIIIITHDLGVVAQICDEVAVMYAGRLIERGTAQDIFYHPEHEYSKGLLDSIPKLDTLKEKLNPIKGNPVDVFSLPLGCSFAPRCKNCLNICLEKMPCAMDVDEHHSVRCFQYLKKRLEEGSISQEQYDEIISKSLPGNDNFSVNSLVDLYDMEKHIKGYKSRLKGELKGKENDPEWIKVHDKYVRISKKYYYKRHNYHVFAKEKRYAEKENFSLQLGDIKRKFKDAKKVVFNGFETEEKEKEFFDNLYFSPIPVNQYLKQEDIDKIKKEIETDKKNISSQEEKGLWISSLKEHKNQLKVLETKFKHENFLKTKSDKAVSNLKVYNEKIKGGK